MTAGPLVVVHGGAGRVHPSLHAAVIEGTARACDEAWQVLASSGDAEAAATAAVRVMEDDVPFNAGHGACMNRLGAFETDAGIMRSRDGAIGAVAGVPELADPINLARWIMGRSEHALLCGPAAADLGRREGVGRFGRDHLWTQKAQDRYDAATAGRMDKDGLADTVGAVVLDAAGHLCAAGSTGGVLLKTPGRVGDTPIPGAGFYARARLGACVATGKGEAMLQDVFCLRLLEAIAREGRGPTEVAREVCGEACGRRCAGRHAGGVVRERSMCGRGTCT